MKLSKFFREMDDMLFEKKSNPSKNFCKLFDNRLKKFSKKMVNRAPWEIYSKVLFNHVTDYDGKIAMDFIRDTYLLKWVSFYKKLEKDSSLDDSINRLMLIKSARDGNKIKTNK